MFTATVKGFQRFPEITADIERLVKIALDEAAVEAAAVANASASIRLELEEHGAQGTVDGYSSGIKSRRKTSVPGRTTPIAEFFNDGTLGKRTRALKRPRKQQWTVNRGGTSYVAHRGDITGEGIAAERFFQKARAAGKRVLVERIGRGL